MEILTFNHGRRTFCVQSFEMVPSLPDLVEPRVQVHYIAEHGFAKTGFVGFDELKDQVGDQCLWLHLTGTLDADFWKGLAAYTDISDENLKQLKNPHARSFIEDSPSGIFWTVLRPFVTSQFDGLEMVNFFLGKNILITRQFSHDDVFSAVVHRLFAQEERVAGFTCDRLAADLLENVIRSYHDVLTAGGAKLESLQTRIIKNPGKIELDMINRAQQLVWIFLKSVWPIETVTHVLARSKTTFISADGKLEFSQCHEEASSVLRLFETYREMSYDIMDVYVSGLGLRTNETTKILTIIATLFLPPTLIAGIYGMNFQIPEVNFPLGYYLCLGSMLCVSGGLLIWLYKRGFIEFR
ncbi:MAG: CorA family divalent cation transporter [Candidatus Melainabacteria bacterium]|nr:CorA family divalent cation transporter [Candidatus Melainabacteria bacterium]